MQYHKSDVQQHIFWDTIYIYIFWGIVYINYCVYLLYALHSCVFPKLSFAILFSCQLYVFCLLNKSYFVKVIVTLHKLTWNGMRVFNRDETKGQSKPSGSYCNLSAGWHGDASAFNLLEGVVLIILPTNRERQTNITTRPDWGTPERCLHRNIKRGTWQLAQARGRVALPPDLCNQAHLWGSKQ